MDITGRRSVKQRLEDISDALERIQRYSRGLSLGDLKNNPLIQDAIIWRLMVLKEATHQIPTEVKQQYSQVDWKRLENLLHELTLGKYRGLSVIKSAQVVDAEMPAWKQKIAEIIESTV